MLLTIDIGNTNVLFGVFDGERLVDTWRVETGEMLEFSDKLKEYAITDAILSSVVPRLNTQVEAQCTAAHIALMNISDPSVDKGIEVLVNESEVGADRIVNAVAGVQKYGAPLIILDFGTATTFDVVNAKGQYVGGVIATGINLSLQTLVKKTAQLPHIKITKPAHVIGNSTETAMQSGIFWGYKGLIEGIISGIKSEIYLAGSDADEASHPITTIATGGLAAVFFEECDVIDHLDTNLTLNGLVHIFKQNKNKTI